MAIEINELRVGNWLINRGKLIRVDGFIFWHYSFPNDAKHIIEISHLEPIPLTLELLVACGFSYIKVKGVASLDEYNPVREESTHNWTLNIKREGIYDGEGRLELVKWGDSPKEKIYFSNQWLRVEMKHLHQLQNLYFSLTQKELPIKL